MLPLSLNKIQKKKKKNPEVHIFLGNTPVPSLRTQFGNKENGWQICNFLREKDPNAIWEK